jgi:hypothetical protein
MRVDYYEAVTYGASVYCAPPKRCLPVAKGETRKEIMDSAEVSPVFASSEWDSYPVCDTCRAEFDYVQLTADGAAWLAKREGREAAHYFETLDSFTKAYVHAALWTSNDEADDAGGEPLDKNYEPGDFALESLQSAARVCQLFQTENAADLDATARDAGTNGHDFWLTRNHHGAGFWDGDLPEDLGRRLTDAAQAFGECNAYVGDAEGEDGDVKLYFSEPYDTLAACVAELKAAGRNILRHDGGRYFTVEGEETRYNLTDVYALASRLKQ